MRIAIVGGGPGGLYFAALTKGLDAGHEMTVWERNAPDDTFGFGVVFSDETLGGIEHADPVIHEQMEGQFARWDDIDVAGPRSRVHGRRPGLRGDEPPGAAAHPAAALRRARRHRPLPDRGAGPRRAAASYDLVVAADGLNSTVRTRYADVFRPTLDRRRNKYIWLGTDLVFDAFKFYVKRDAEWGIMQIHGYPYSDAGSAPSSSRCTRTCGAGPASDRTEREVFPPGASDETPIAADPRDLRRRARRATRSWPTTPGGSASTPCATSAWRHENVVLLGDAAHTAHFSIGSGTKLAMEDALALAACLHEQPTTEAALDAYETERRPVVALDAASGAGQPGVVREHRQYAGQDPAQFAFNLLTRRRRITYDNLAVRDPEFVGADGGRVRAATRTLPRRAPAMFQPVTLGELELTNRVIVSPMDMYSAEDGLPNDFHLVHLGSQSARRRRAGDDRDGVRLARRAGSRRAAPALERRPSRRRLPADHGLRAHEQHRRRSGSSSGTPAARARPGSCGRAWTSRCPRATGR